MAIKETFDLKRYWSDQATILSHMKRFHLAVDKFRKDHKIPANGIALEKRAGWYESFFLNPTFFAEEKLGSRSDYELLPANNDFMNDLETLAADFGLESRWLMPLFIMISSGSDIVEPPSAKSVVLLPRLNDARLTNEQQTVTRILLEIRKDCAQSDVVDIWPEIKRLQKRMIGEVPGKRKQIDPATIKRYLKIRAMEDAGATQSIIADELRFDTSHDVSRFKANEIENRFRKTIPPLP